MFNKQPIKFKSANNIQLDYEKKKCYRNKKKLTQLILIWIFGTSFGI